MADTISIGPFVEEIKLDSLPSSNFGPGVELLMNGRKKETEAPESISLNDIDSLEKELNDLSSGGPSVSFDSPKANDVKNIFNMPAPQMGGSVKFMDDFKEKDKEKEVEKSKDPRKHQNMGRV